MPPKDIEERKLELERERLVIETRLKEAELEFQREQLNVSSKGFFAWIKTPIGAAVIAGLLGLFGTVLNSFQSNLIEQRKQESNLILEAIKTSGTGDEKRKQTAANLVFLAKAGLIQLTEAKIKDLEKIAGDNSLPSLPAVKTSNIDDVPTPTLRDNLIERITNPKNDDPNATSSPNVAGNDEAGLYEQIKASFKSRGYSFDTASGHINIVGIRQLDNIDKYDDVIFLVWNDSTGKHAKEFRAACDPGEYYTKNPQNPIGVANLKDGQSDYQLGQVLIGKPNSHKGLRPVGDQNVWRDVNKNFEFDYEDMIDTGNFGLLICAGVESNEDVNKGSGSQLIYGGKDSEEYKSFLKILESASPEQKTFRYTLITVPKGQVKSGK